MSTLETLSVRASSEYGAMRTDVMRVDVGVSSMHTVPSGHPVKQANSTLLLEIALSSDRETPTDLSIDLLCSISIQDAVELPPQTGFVPMPGWPRSAKFFHDCVPDQAEGPPNSNK